MGCDGDGKVWVRDTRWLDRHSALTAATAVMKVRETIAHRWFGARLLFHGGGDEVAELPEGHDAAGEGGLVTMNGEGRGRG